MILEIIIGIVFWIVISSSMQLFLNGCYTTNKKHLSDFIQYDYFMNQFDKNMIMNDVFDYIYVYKSVMCGIFCSHTINIYINKNTYKRIRVFKYSKLSKEIEKIYAGCK